MDPVYDIPCVSFALILYERRGQLTIPLSLIDIFVRAPQWTAVRPTLESKLEEWQNFPMDAVIQSHPSFLDGGTPYDPTQYFVQHVASLVSNRYAFLKAVTRYLKCPICMNAVRLQDPYTRY